MSQSVHIISFDVPFPANYGGVMDVYYKLLWLKKRGVRIHLHCFTYGRQASAELESLCEEVHYYKRRTGLLSNLSFLPYNVVSRRSKELEQNLLANDFPILFEVLHTCYLLNDPRFKTRKKIFRHSNIEHVYYQELSRIERKFLKKLYLKVEAWKLRLFEPIVNHANVILAVNEKDRDYFGRMYPKPSSLYLPSFHPNETLNARLGRGEYLLFHGNLSVSENYEAASWLITNVFSRVGHKVIVAGLNPPGFLVKQIAAHQHVHLEANPNESRMRELLENAQGHVLYTQQPTGLKLKLLNVLFGGRFILCNAHMIAGTPLKADASFFLAETGDEFIASVNGWMHSDFTGEMLAVRQKQTDNFSNELNVDKLIRAIFQ